MIVGWFLALLPALLGLGAMIAATYGLLPNPILYLRGDLAAFFLLVGLLLSGLGLAVQTARHLERRRYQRLLQQHQAEMNQERQRFLQRLDHQLKGAVAGIRNVLDKLRVNAADDKENQTLDYAQRDALRLTRLVRGLRDLAELETRPLEKGPIDVGNLLRAVVRTVARSRDEQGRVRLALPEAPWPLPLVLGDEEMLAQALYNLLDNALKFTPPDGRVEVRALERGGMVRIEIADTGMGIPAEEMPHLGEELFRGQGARALPGSGLGLALARVIVERHDGGIAVQSRVDQGTLVTVELPTR